MDFFFILKGKSLSTQNFLANYLPWYWLWVTPLLSHSVYHQWGRNAEMIHTSLKSRIFTKILCKVAQKEVFLFLEIAKAFLSNHFKCLVRLAKFLNLLLFVTCIRHIGWREPKFHYFNNCKWTQCLGDRKIQLLKCNGKR